MKHPKRFYKDFEYFVCDIHSPKQTTNDSKMDFVLQVSLWKGRFSGLKIKKYKIHFAEISLAAQNKLSQCLEYIECVTNSGERNMIE